MGSTIQPRETEYASWPRGSSPLFDFAKPKYLVQQNAEIKPIVSKR